MAETPQDNQWNLKLLHTLNAAAIALQSSASTVEDIFRVFEAQLELAAMGGVIALLDTPDHWMDNPDATATVLSNAISHPVIRKFEKKLNLSANHLNFKLARATTMQTVIRTQKSQLIADSQPLTSEYLPQIAQPFAGIIGTPFKNIPTIIAPLLRQNRAVGILAFTTPGLTPKDIPAIEAFAHHIGIALENVTLIKNLREEIEQRKRTTAELQASETRYRMLIDSAPVAMTIHDGKTMRFINPALKKLLGIEHEEDVLGQSIWKYISADSLPVTTQRIAEVVQQGLPVPPMEEKFIAPDGKVLEVEAAATPITFDGKPASLVVFHDISPQKQARRQLEHQLSQLTLLNKIGQEISTMFNLQQLFTRTTHLVHQKFGYHHVAIFMRDEQQSAMVMQAHAGGYAALFPPHHTLKPTEGMVGWVVRFKQTLVANDVTQEPSHFNPMPGHPAMQTRSELAIPLTVSGVVEGVLDIQSPELNAFDEQQVMVMETLAQQLATAIENARFFDAIASELTERKRAEASLRQSNHELRLLNKIISVTAASPKLSNALTALCREFVIALNVTWTGVITVARNGKSGTIAATHQLDRQETSIPVGTHFPFPKPIRKWLQNPRSVTLANVESSQELSGLFPAMAQLKQNLWTLFVPIMDGEHTVGILVAGATTARQYSDADIALAERVGEQLGGIMARMQLERTREKLTAAIEQSTEAVLITDAAGKVTYVNAAFSKMSGYAAADMLGTNPIHLAKTDVTMQTISRALLINKTWQGNVEIQVKTGGTFTGETVIMPIRTAKKAPKNYAVTVRDITRQLALEEQLRQSQKLKAVGQLAAGIAHDFNNLLTAVNGFSELLLERVTFGSLEHEYVLQILESGNRAAKLVRQMLAFSRKQLISPKVLNLNQVILDMETMLRRVIGAHIAIKMDLTPNIFPLKLDATQIEQIIINLAVNAQDAMPNGGTLHISTANVLLSPEYTATHPDIEPGEFVCLTVTDTGKGIAPDVLAHIFEPFFTTKEVGKGTGLGLATVYGVIKQNKGHIDVTSTEGKGTTFYIYLPRTFDAAASPQMEVPSDMPSGKETILLVEDSPHVLDLAQTILLELGYTVYSSETAEQAIERARQLEKPVDLLVTDVMLPRMNGFILASAIQQLYPAIKILYTSGYDKASLPINIETLDNGAGFLQKPFTASQMAQLVREILDQQPLPQ